MAFDWLQVTVWDSQLPLTLLQWCLTPYGGCLGLTHSERTRPPVVSLHPAVWGQTHLSSNDCWAAKIPAGPRYSLDVLTHELVHVEVNYLRGGSTGKSSHDCPEWCAAIERVGARLEGTMLELPAFKAQPTKRFREEEHQRRHTPDGCISMPDCSRWPQEVYGTTTTTKISSYHFRTLGYDWILNGGERPSHLQLRSTKDGWGGMPAQANGRKLF